MVITLGGMVKIALVDSSFAHLAVKVFKIVNFLLLVRYLLDLVSPEQILVNQLFNFGFALRTRIFYIFDPFANALEAVGMLTPVQLRFLFNWHIFQANATRLVLLH